MSFSKVALFAAALAAPVAGYAQSSQPVSRAEVRAKLVEVEQAGFAPQDYMHYPENLQAAEAKIATQNAEAQGALSGYGGAADGTVRSGRAPGQ